MIGAEEHQVDELKTALAKGFIGSEAISVLVLEVEAYPEPKSLTAGQLRKLIIKFGSSRKVGNVIGACEAFVRQNSTP
jgi:hypothetical protein